MSKEGDGIIAEIKKIVSKGDQTLFWNDVWVGRRH